MSGIGLEAPLPDGFKVTSFFEDSVIFGEPQEPVKRKTQVHVSQSKLKQKAELRRGFQSRTFGQVCRTQKAIEENRPEDLADALMRMDMSEPPLRQAPHRRRHHKEAAPKAAPVLRRSTEPKSEPASLPRRREALFDLLEQGCGLIDPVLQEAWFDTATTVVVEVERAKCRRMKQLEELVAGFAPVAEIEAFRLFSSQGINNPLLLLAKSFVAPAAGFAVLTMELV